MGKGKELLLIYSPFDWGENEIIELFPLVEFPSLGFSNLRYRELGTLFVM